MKKLKINTDHWDRWLAQSFEDDGHTLVSYEVIINYLRHGERLRFPTAIRLLQCMIRSSFEPWVCYEVYEYEEAFYLLKTICRLTDPREVKMGRKYRSGFVPQFEYNYHKIKSSSVTNIIQDLKVPISAISEGSIGGDGVRYELATTLGFQSSRFEWWSEVNSEWEPLVQQFNKIFENFETFFDE